MTNLVEKRLKNKSFNKLSSALGCTLFVVYALIVDIIVGTIPAAVKQNLAVAILLSFLIEAVFIFASITVSSVQRVEFFEATNMNKRAGLASILIAITISLVTLFSFSNLTNAFVMLMQNLGYQSQSSQIVIPNFGIYLLYVFLLCLCPALFEESLFRGVILNGLKGYGKHVAVLASAAIFMLMHGGPDQTVHQFLLGIVLGYAYLASGSFWVPFTIHFTNNFIAVTTIYQAGSGHAVFTMSNFTPWSSVLLVLASGIVAALVGGYIIKLLIARLAAQRKKAAELKEQQLATQAAEGDGEKAQAANKEQTPASPTITGIMDEAKRKKKESILSTVFYAISITYLVVNWILACIVGFGG